MYYARVKDFIILNSHFYGFFTVYVDIKKKLKNKNMYMSSFGPDLSNILQET